MNVRNLPLLLVFVTILFTNKSTAQTKILFDDTKNETSGSADWVIDADGTKYGVAKLPTPDQSTITANTAETYWTGALSSWGIDCVNKGFHVESLPSNGKITYGDKTNAQDLSNYKVYIIDEPNTLFTATEKTALLNFVKNGGGLFIISDHAGSDRNNDGSDSPTVWDDLFTNNGSVTNPFGISFDVSSPNLKLYPSDITEVSTNVTKTNNPITNGTYGTVTKISYSAGTTMVLDTTANKTVKGVVFASKSTGILNGVMVAYAKYGKGKIVAIGDSSPIDDGTGFTNTGLYKSYSGDSKVGDNHRYFCMNATIWLATTDSTLPIKFVDITGKTINNTTIINWQVNESGFNNSYYIEKSLDGTNFEVVGTVGSKNNVNSGLENYECKVAGSATAYYRIKTVDNDGSVSYSKTIEIKNTNKSNITIFPNPLSLRNGGTFSINGLNIGSKIGITDQKGKVYYESIAQNESIVINPPNKLAAGVYIVTIKDNMGNMVNTRKVVVTK